MLKFRSQNRSSGTSPSPNTGSLAQAWSPGDRRLAPAGRCERWLLEGRAAGALAFRLTAVLALVATGGLWIEHLLPGHHVHLGDDSALHHHHFFVGPHEHEHGPEEASAGHDHRHGYGHGEAHAHGPAHTHGAGHQGAPHQPGDGHERVAESLDPGPAGNDSEEPSRDGSGEGNSGPVLLTSAPLSPPTPPAVLLPPAHRAFTLRALPAEGPPALLVLLSGRPRGPPA